MPDAKTFVTWTAGGVRYLAAQQDDSWFILDEDGGWYGAWVTVEAFRKRAKEEGVLTYRLSATMRLTARPA